MPGPPHSHLRYARGSDSGAIADYHGRCWHDSFRGLVADELIDAVALDGMGARWATFLADLPLGVSVVVATVDDQPIGHVTVGPAEDDSGTGAMYSLFVDPERQGTGIGSTLHDVGNRLLRRNGFTEGTLWTIRGNAAAIAFYERRGWELDGASKMSSGFDAVGEFEEVRMRRALDESHVERNRTYWNESAPSYESPGHAAWSRTEPRWGIFGAPNQQAQMMPDVAGKDVVELGCGTAYVAAWCARAGARSVVGIDNSPAQLATAKALQLEFDLRFPLLWADAEQTPFTDSSFDVAISEYGACLWCDPFVWIPEVARLLRPGGTLAFLTNSIFAALTANDFESIPPTGEMLRPLRGMHRLSWPDIEGSEFHLAHGAMMDLLRQHGFVDIRLIELFAESDDEPSDGFVTGPWASKWPHEEVWLAQRA